MSYDDNDYGGESGNSGNVWSSGSRGGYSRSNDDGNGARGGGSYDGSFGNNNARRGGGGSGGSYGFRRNDNGNVQILHDAIFIQDLPKSVTNDELFDVFSAVGKIKTDDRSGGPKIWIYKDRDTGEPNGRAQVTFESDETADRAVSQFNDQRVDSLDATIRVQIAQRRNRNNDGDRGGRGGYRGGRSNWDNNNSRQGGFNSRGRGGWGDSSGGFSGGRGGGFRGQRSGGDSYRDNDDRGSYGGGRGSGSYRGNRDAPYRGASHVNSGSSNYTPY